MEDTNLIGKICALQAEDLLILKAAVQHNTHDEEEEESALHAQMYLHPAASR